MKKAVLFFSVSCMALGVEAQQVATIAFNLYTDSLKKGFYNYISVDGQYADGRWLPLDTTHLKLSANTGHFKGNDLFIDSTYRFDSVVVKAVLRSNPKIWKEAIIYIRKRGFTEPLKTSEEILQEVKPKPKSRKRWGLS